MPNPSQPATPARALPVALSAGQKASERKSNRLFIPSGLTARNSGNLSLLDSARFIDQIGKTTASTPMPRIPKTELSPDNGCISAIKWQLGPLSYHASAAGKEPVPLVTQSTRLPEVVLYDHVGFKG